MGGSYRGAGHSDHGIDSRHGGDPRPVHIHAGSRQIRLDAPVPGVPSAGVDKKAAVHMIVSADGNRKVRIAGSHNSGVRVCLEKVRVRGYEPFNREPHMVHPGKRDGGIDPDPPDPRDRGDKTQGGQIAALKS